MNFKVLSQIIVIGTHPPCPRCKLLTKVISDKVKELSIPASVKHLCYTDAEAMEFAGKFGLTTGTAKDVAKKSGLEIDSEKIKGIIANPLKNVGEYKDYKDCNWSYELDEFLKPYQIKAKEAGILMTPVVIINGKLKHQGSVPPLNDIVNWLIELK